MYVSAQKIEGKNTTNNFIAKRINHDFRNIASVMSTDNLFAFLIDEKYATCHINKTSRLQLLHLFMKLRIYTE